MFEYMFLNKRSFHVIPVTCCCRLQLMFISAKPREITLFLSFGVPQDTGKAFLIGTTIDGVFRAGQKNCFSTICCWGFFIEADEYVTDPLNKTFTVKECGRKEEP